VTLTDRPEPLHEQTPESFWAEVLSAKPERIRPALEALSEDERRSVIAHLGRMLSEAGWHAAQRDRARVALGVASTLQESP
jgi:hypothetical protein